MISKTDFQEDKGYIFDIQGLSVHDGPGCRTLIFLSGCTLKCFWCSNPEGISGKPSLLYFSRKCIRCGNCVQACQHNAIKIEGNQHRINRSYCLHCEKNVCLEECYTDALQLGGYEISVSKLFSIIQRDRNYWGSGGGITLTGGEPLLQIDFVKEILKRCHDSFIHTAIETCGNVPWSSFLEVLPYLDWIFFDLKHTNKPEHKEATSAENVLILENACLLSTHFTGRLIFRLPLIPGFNDTDENITSTIAFLKNIRSKEINVLPLHHLGREKYEMLGIDYKGNHFPVPTIEQLRQVAATFNDAGILCYIGSETPY